MNKVLIVGSGNMGEAMLRGWVKASNEQTKIYVREPNPSNWLKKMNAKKKITLNPLDIKGQINVCIFAVKPQVAEQVIKDNKNLEDKLYEADNNISDGSKLNLKKISCQVS